MKESAAWPCGLCSCWHWRWPPARKAKTKAPSARAARPCHRRALRRSEVGGQGDQTPAKGGREPEWATPLMRRSQAHGGARRRPSIFKPSGIAWRLGKCDQLKGLKGGSLAIRDISKSHYVSAPPFTWIIWPFTKAPPSDTSMETTAAISCGCPSLPTGTRDIMLAMW